MVGSLKNKNEYSKSFKYFTLVICAKKIQRQELISPSELLLPKKKSIWALVSLAKCFAFERIQIRLCSHFLIANEILQGIFS